MRISTRCSQLRLFCIGVQVDAAGLALPHSDISLKGISYESIYHVIYVFEFCFPTDTKPTNEHFPSYNNTPLSSFELDISVN